jgi:hypothetical protein
LPEADINYTLEKDKVPCFLSSFKELVKAVQNMPRSPFKQGVTLEKPSLLSDCGKLGLYVVQSLLSSFALHWLQRLECGLSELFW